MKLRHFNIGILIFMCLFAALNNGLLNYYLSIPFLLILAKKYAYPSKRKYIWLPAVVLFGALIYFINNQVPKSQFLYSKINDQITLNKDQEIFRVNCKPEDPCYRDASCRDSFSGWRFSQFDTKPIINCYDTQVLPKGNVLSLKKVVYKFGIIDTSPLFDGEFGSSMIGSDFVIASDRVPSKISQTTDETWKDFGRTKVGERVDTIVVLIVWAGIFLGIGLFFGLVFDILKFIFFGIWELGKDED